MKKIVFGSLIIIVLAGLTITGIILVRQKGNNALSFEAVTVTRKDVNAFVLATGSVKPMIGAEVKVGARISGKVEHLYANIGDKVEQNQVWLERFSYFQTSLAVVGANNFQIFLSQTSLSHR